MNLRNVLRSSLTTAAVFTASFAHAGPADSPVPSISATAATRVLYIVPGVIKNNGLESAIMCTSLDSIAGRLAFEVFAPEGGAPLNNVATGVANGAIGIIPGETVTISTGTSVGLHEDLTITGMTNVKNGSARILGTSTRILCTGLVVDKLGTTPNTIATLKIFARHKQNGD